MQLYGCEFVKQLFSTVFWRMLNFACYGCIYRTVMRVVAWTGPVKTMDTGRSLLFTASSSEASPSFSSSSSSSSTLSSSPPSSSCQLQKQIKLKICTCSISGVITYCLLVVTRGSLKNCQDIRFTASCDICQFKTLRVPTLKTHICWRPECSYKAPAKNHQQLQQDKKTDSRIGNTRGLW